MKDRQTSDRPMKRDFGSPADTATRMRGILGELSKDISSARHIRVHVEIGIDSLAYEYFSALDHARLRLPRTEANLGPTLYDWMLYAEILTAFRVNHVHFPELHANLHRRALVPDFFFLALAQVGEASAIGYDLIPMFEPKILDESCFSRLDSALSDQTLVLDPGSELKLKDGAFDGFRLSPVGPHQHLFERVNSVAAFVLEMRPFLESMTRKGYTMVEGVPPETEGDFDTMLFMKADAALRQSDSAIYHFSGDVEPGKAVLSAFFQLKRKREILAPIVAYSATMYGTGGFDDMLRSMARAT